MGGCKCTFTERERKVDGGAGLEGQSGAAQGRGGDSGDGRVWGGMGVVR